MNLVSDYWPGGRTGEFKRTPHYQDFIRRFRIEEQTALWNRGMGEDDIIEGLAEATGLTESVVYGWFTKEQRYNNSLDYAVGHWAATKWHKKFPAYYPAVSALMHAPHSAEGRVEASCLLKCMKMSVPPEYIVEGIRMGFSWQQVIYGAENGIAIEYLSSIIGEKKADDDSGY
jgi:hypothetical protein